MNIEKIMKQMKDNQKKAGRRWIQHLFVRPLKEREATAMLGRPRISAHWVNDGVNSDQEVLHYSGHERGRIRSDM